MHGWCVAAPFCLSLLPSSRLHVGSTRPCVGDIPQDNNGSLLGGWRAGKYYPGRDSSGRLLQALPELMAKPAALLLEDAGGGTQHADESEGAGAQEAQDECAAPHEALRFPALVA